MSAAYNPGRFLNDLEERRYSWDFHECYMGDCEPEDYDGDNCGDGYHPEDWEKHTI